MHYQIEVLAKVFTFIFKQFTCKFNKFTSKDTRYLKDNYGCMLNYLVRILEM